MEVEIKFLEINKDEIIRKLEKLGAKKVFEGYITDLFFDFDDMNLTKNGKLLRLRKMGNNTKLTFKEKISKDRFKVTEELELTVSDFEIMKNILENLGLKIIWKVEKHRISFVLGDVNFEIDTYFGIPTLLEIEAQDETTLEKYVKLLDLSLEKGKTWTGREVLEYYRKL